jgi:hypothetical protein
VSDRGDLLARSFHLCCDRTLFNDGLEHATVQLSRSLGCLSRSLGVHSRFFGVLASAFARSASRLGFDSQRFARFSKELGVGASGLRGVPVGLGVGCHVGTRRALRFSNLPTLFSGFAMALAYFAVPFVVAVRRSIGVCHGYLVRSREFLRAPMRARSSVDANTGSADAGSHYDGTPLDRDWTVQTS